MIQSHHTQIYDPILQWKRYEEITMLLNSDETMGSLVTKTDEIEQIIGIIMAQQYRLKSGLNIFSRRRNMWYHQN